GERDQLAVDLRAHRHRVERARGADAVKVDWYISDLRLDGEDRHGLARRGVAGASLALAFALLSSSLLPGGLPGRPIINDACHEGQADQGKSYSSGAGHQCAFIAPFFAGGIQPPPSA